MTLDKPADEDVEDRDLVKELQERVREIDQVTRNIDRTINRLKAKRAELQYDKEEFEDVIEDTTSRIEARERRKQLRNEGIEELGGALNPRIERAIRGMRKIRSAEHSDTESRSHETVVIHVAPPEKEELK